MEGPFVSIIVPNYNHEAFLRERLDSIFKQSYRNFEVILLDDHSTDKSPEILKEYAQNKEVSYLVLNTENSGSPFKQWQKGIALAKGEFIWMAESDDYCSHDFLEKLISLNTQHDGTLDILYAQSNDVDETGTVKANRIYYTENFTPNIWQSNFVCNGDEFIQKYLKVKCIIPNASAVIFKKSLMEKHPFSEEHLKMRMCGDWLFWLKVSSDSKIGFVVEALNSFREHAAVTRNHSDYQKVLRRCVEEKKVREYLDVNHSIDQKEEIIKLYKRWFRVNSFSKLFTSNFYEVKMTQTSLKEYLNYYFAHHRTREKLIAKINK